MIVLYRYLSGGMVAATVAAIGDVVDPATRTIKVRAWVNNDPHKLKPEMFARGEINLGLRKLPVIPRAAVVQDGAESFVMVRRGGSAEKPAYAVEHYKNLLSQINQLALTTDAQQFETAAKQSDRLTASELAIWHQIKAGQRS